MRARNTKANKSYRDTCKEILEQSARDKIAKAIFFGEKRMLLKVFYILRFDFEFLERLNRLFNSIIDLAKDGMELQKDGVEIEFYIKKLEESGFDCRDFFSDLLELEEEMYKRERKMRGNERRKI